MVGTEKRMGDGKRVGLKKGWGMEKGGDKRRWKQRNRLGMSTQSGDKQIDCEQKNREVEPSKTVGEQSDPALLELELGAVGP